MSDARVVLLKPGDVLLVGNVGQADTTSVTKALDGIKQALGLAGVALFTGDIDLAAVSGPESITGPATSGALGDPGSA